MQTLIDHQRGSRASGSVLGSEFTLQGEDGVTVLALIIVAAGVHMGNGSDYRCRYGADQLIVNATYDARRDTVTCFAPVVVTDAVKPSPEDTGRTWRTHHGTKTPDGGGRLRVNGGDRNRPD